MTARVDRLAKVTALSFLPSAWIAFEVARRFPEWTEVGFARVVYPAVVRFLAAVSPGALSLAEWSAPPLAAMVTYALYRLVKRPGSRLAALSRVAFVVWTLAGIAAWAFLLSWGFHYARPPLAARLEMDRESPTIEVEEVLALARRSAADASFLFSRLAPEARRSPSRLPMSFETLSESVDAAFERLRLPGDHAPRRVAAAKPLRSSSLLAHLGISGIFVPFTGEPSVNDLQPDAALPMVVAHEKAHQRGITHEGEASFAGFLACSDPGSPVYLRYSAHLYATRALIGEASRYAPEERVSAVWEALADGPRADAAAIHEFWQRYDGAATRAASRVNDGYLRAMRVPEGVASYGTVTAMLVALERQGRYPNR